MPGVVLFDLPTPLAAGSTGKLVTTIQCHKDMEMPLRTAFACMAKQGVALRTYSGCYCYRNKINRNELSNHATGLAIDFDSKWNWYGAVPTMDPRIVACFEEAGFSWGGRWTTPDGMHFELRR